MSKKVGYVRQLGLRSAGDGTTRIRAADHPDAANVYEGPVAKKWVSVLRVSMRDRLPVEFELNDQGEITSPRLIIPVREPVLTAPPKSNPTTPPPSTVQPEAAQPIPTRDESLDEFLDLFGSKG